MNLLLARQVIGLLTIGLFAACLSAQTVTHGLPGGAPGTERWIVEFKTRSFDLAAFRRAILDREPAVVVDRIVAGLDARMRKDQAPFAQQVVADFGGKVVTQWWLINACLIEVAPRHLPQIRSLPRVLRLQPDREAFPQIQKSTDAKNHRTDAVQKAGHTGKGVTVAVLDTGHDEKMGTTNRPHRLYFVGGNPKNTTGGGIAGSRLLVSRKMGASASDDTTGHGTAISSILAGGNWGTKGADDGHAPAAGIAGYSLSNNIGGYTTKAIMASAWQQVAKDRAKFGIVTGNLSFSGSWDPTSVEQQALDAAAYNADILICVAAANYGSLNTYSQGAANGLSVGAITADSHTVWSRSSRGPLADGRNYPDLAACGVNLVMAQRDNEAVDYTNSGTSGACPQVCGIATLVRAANKKLNALQTRAIVLAACQDVAAQNPTYDRNAFGFGMPRADAAIKLATTVGQTGVGSVSKSTKTVRVPVQVSQGKHYALAVAWNRTLVQKKAWSNLDVRVLSGTTPVAVAASKNNLQEVVRFLATRSETLTLEVTGVSLDATTVPFGWAFGETPPVPVPAAVRVFGKGCPGTGFPPPTPCHSANMNQSLGTSVGAAGDVYLMEVTAPQNLSVEGFRVLARTAKGTVMVATSLWDANGKGEPGQVLATSTMQVGAQASSYQTVFGKSTVFAKGKRFFLGIQVPAGAATLTLPIVSGTTSTNTPFWIQMIDKSWRRLTQTAWAWSVLCKVTKRGAVPVLSARGTPVLGSSFVADVRHGRENAAALLLVGASNSKWAGVALPWTIATGCQVLVSGDLAQPLRLSSSGSRTLTVRIPNQKGLLGVHYFAQVGVMETTGWALSNGLDLKFGDVR